MASDRASTAVQNGALLAAADEAGCDRDSITGAKRVLPRLLNVQWVQYGVGAMRKALLRIWPIIESSAYVYVCQIVNILLTLSSTYVHERNR